MGKDMRENGIPEIWETEEEKHSSIGQLKYRYLQFARQNFQGKVFFNKDTKNPIRVSRDGIMEWWRKSRKREHIISVQLLDYFLENAVFIEENPDYKNRPEIEGASLYESLCKVMGNLLKLSSPSERASMIWQNSGITLLETYNFCLYK